MVTCFLILILITIKEIGANTSILQKISNDRNFSRFYSLLENDRLARITLGYGEITIFVPINEGFPKNDHHSDTGNLAPYHIVWYARSLNNLSNDFLPTILLENPPLWITRTDDEIFVNNAKIIVDRSNVSIDNFGGKNQYMHVLDRFLDPVIERHPPGFLFNPSALQLIGNCNRFQLTPWSTISFHQKIIEYQQEKLFLHYWSVTPGTFFIPIDSSINWDQIDIDIILTHVVPSKILFTRTTPRDIPYGTLSGDEFIETVVTFTDYNDKILLKTYRLLKNSTNIIDESISEIIKANIPVRNGVVHLINRPLIDSNKNHHDCRYLIDKLLIDPTLSLYFDYGGDKITTNNRTNQKFTLFIPTNRAWERLRNNFAFSSTYLKSFMIDSGSDLLGRHLVLSNVTLTMDRLKKLSVDPDKANVVLETLGGKIMIGVARVEGIDYIFWSDKVIRIYRSDYRCIDGVIHVIDDVFATLQDFRV